MCSLLNLALLNIFTRLLWLMRSHDLPKISAEAGPSRQWVQRAARVIAAGRLAPSAVRAVRAHGLVRTQGDFAVLRRAGFSRQAPLLRQGLEYFV